MWSLERYAGNKIIQIQTEDGKINPEMIVDTLIVLGDEHAVQPKIISISQVTELGTLYEVDEIKALADFAHKNGLYLHVDGARIANAVCALNSSFKEMLTDTGVDLVSFGGTKNGMMIGLVNSSFWTDIGTTLPHIIHVPTLHSKALFWYCPGSPTSAVL